MVEKLVVGYPSHEYIIDYRELKELVFNVELFAPDAGGEAVKGLMEMASQDRAFIDFVEPTAGTDVPVSELASVPASRDPEEAAQQ